MINRIVSDSETLFPVSFIAPDGRWHHMVCTESDRCYVLNNETIEQMDVMKNGRWQELTAVDIREAWNQARGRDTYV